MRERIGESKMHPTLTLDRGPFHPLAFNLLVFSRKNGTVMCRTKCVIL